MSDKVCVYSHKNKKEKWLNVEMLKRDVYNHFGEDWEEQQLEIVDYEVSYSCLTNWSLDEFLSYSRDFYELSDLEKEIVNGMVREFAWWLTEAIYDVNTVEIYYCSDDESFGQEVIRARGNFISEDLKNYFDYDKYVQDVMIEKSVLILDEHYVILD